MDDRDPRQRARRTLIRAKRGRYFERNNVASQPLLVVTRSGGRTAISGLLLAISGAQFIMRGPTVHHERTSNKPDCKENRDQPGERPEGGVRGV